MTDPSTVIVTTTTQMTGMQWDPESPDDFTNWVSTTFGFDTSVLPSGNIIIFPSLEDHSHWVAKLLPGYWFLWDELTSTPHPANGDDVHVTVTNSSYTILPG